MPLANVQFFMGGRFLARKTGAEPYLIPSDTVARAYVIAASNENYSLEALDDAEYHCIYPRETVARFWNRRQVTNETSTIEKRDLQFLYVARGKVHCEGQDMGPVSMLDLSGKSAHAVLEEGALAALMWQ